MPGEDVGAVVDAGAVHVVLGSASGLVAAGSQYWSQISAGVADSAEVGDRFGSALAMGRLDGGALADLVVGVPGESVGAVAGAGVVQVLPGAAGGVTASGSQLWSQSSTGIADSVEGGDGFGASLAVGDVNGAAGDDLAVGVPGEDVGAVVDAGAVHVVLGSASGLVAAGSQYWSQISAGVADSAEVGDRFGSALAMGRLDGGALADLVVGVPGESVGAVAGAGVVQVLPGAAGGVTASGSQLWSQSSTGIADSVEGGDGFGASLAVGDVNGAAGDDLAVGVPGEDVGAVVDVGRCMWCWVGVGLVAAGSQLVQFGGVADSAEVGDRFGSARRWSP